MGNVPEVPEELSPAPGSGRAAAAQGVPGHLTAVQVAVLLGGKIIGSYPNAGPAAYGPRDAATVLMAHGRRVALRDGAYFIDGERAAPEVMEKLAAELTAQDDRQGR